MATQTVSSTAFADQMRRKITAMGTVGDVGASYTVYEKNWPCPACKYENYASRFRCTRCKTPKPEGTDNIITDVALEASAHGPPGGGWKEAIDPNTQHLYYFNSITGESRWDRPNEMGHAPMASGWFGRGSAGKASDEYLERNKRYLTRPARKQKEHIEKSRSVLEGANEFNIWYGKYLGDHWNNKRGRDKADTRCYVETDAGYTKGDKYDKVSKFFCIHFARGYCARGHECQYFHRIPTIHDDAVANELHDCFGRERHASHRDDMYGVGSFTNPSRTLYVGGILKSSYTSQEELEKALWKQFGEWGEVEHLNFVPRLSVAFIRYRLRLNTEFAKEAMANQSLDGEETLNIKWAYDDPNPIAKESIKRSDFDAAVALVQAQGASLEEAPYDYPSDYQLPPAKRLCADAGVDGTAAQLSSAIGEGHAVAAYPNTDSQFTHAEDKRGAVATQERSLPLPDNEEDTESAPKADSQHDEAWTQVFDPNYQHNYWFNTRTSESSWTDPRQVSKDSQGGVPAESPSAENSSSAQKTDLGNGQGNASVRQETDHTNGGGVDIKEDGSIER